MRLVILFRAEMHIVGRNQRQVERIGEVYRGFFLRRAPAAMAHQLDIEAARKQLLQAVQELARRLRPAFRQGAADRAARPAAQRDQAVRAAFEAAPLDMRRLRSRRIQKGGGDEFEQIAVAGFVLRQQQDRRRLVLAAGALPGGGADREQRADDRLDSGAGGMDGEFHRAEEVAGVRDRNRRHPGLSAKRGQVLDPDRPFRKRIGGMHPQMHEIGMTHGRALPHSRRAGT